MVRHIATVSLLLFCTFAATESAALTITLNPGINTSMTRAMVGRGPITHDTEYPTTGDLPYVATLSAGSGETLSVTDFDLSELGFDMSMSHSRSGDADYSAQSVEFIYFSVDEAVPYSLSGSYAVTDAGPNGRQVLLIAYLQDKTDDSFLFATWQESRDQANEVFTLGQNDGTFAAQTAGSLTGTLEAGREYMWNVNAFIANFPAGSTDGATAIGGATLLFVPEPASALLVGLGLLVLARFRRSQ